MHELPSKKYPDVHFIHVEESRQILHPVEHLSIEGTHFEFFKIVPLLQAVQVMESPRHSAHFVSHF